MKNATAWTFGAVAMAMAAAALALALAIVALVRDGGGETATVPQHSHDVTSHTHDVPAHEHAPFGGASSGGFGILEWIGALLSLGGIDGDWEEYDGGDGAYDSASTGASANFVEVPAMIADFQIVVAESWPPQYFVHILSDTPDGCHEYAGYSEEREGATITIEVFNSAPEDLDDLACTAVVTETETSVPLGADFDSGMTYTVIVNGKAQTFEADLGGDFRAIPAAKNGRSG